MNVLNEFRTNVHLNQIYRGHGACRLPCRLTTPRPLASPLPGRDSANWLSSPSARLRSSPYPSAPADAAVADGRGRPHIAGRHNPWVDDPNHPGKKVLNEAPLFAWP